jgi:histidinol dehydrogenase
MIPIVNHNKIDDYLHKIRNAATDVDLYGSVADIISAVRLGGDQSVRDYSANYGEQLPASLKLTKYEIEAAIKKVDAETKEVLDAAESSIRTFAESVMENAEPVKLATEGYELGFQFRPVESVLCYVPGGRYPLPSTALMTAVTAAAAGVENVYLTSPGVKPEVVYAATLAGVKSIYRIGGAQAVAAFAYGTETIPRVNMVVGPGNIWVTEAKRQLQGRIGIDMLAGPSEVCIVAEAGDYAETLALDLLAQAEHDPMARSWLICDDEEFLKQVDAEVVRLRSELKLPDFVGESLMQSALILSSSADRSIELSNRLAPEHLQIIGETFENRVDDFRHYGSAFIGLRSTVAFGDYMAGQNHTLPTNGTARFSSGLSPMSFMRTQTWMKTAGNIDRLCDLTAHFAEVENLRAHAQAARNRKKL